jgi:hypothetical protein
MLAMFAVNTQNFVALRISMGLNKHYFDFSDKKNLETLDLRSFSLPTLEVIERFCSLLECVDDCRRATAVKDVAHFVERSISNRKFFSELLQNDEKKKINFLTNLLFSLDEHIAVRDEYCIFFTENSDSLLKTDPKGKFCLLSGKLELPLPVVEALVNENLVEKFCKLKLVKFWEHEFPWAPAHFIQGCKLVDSSQALYFLLMTGLPLNEIQKERLFELPLIPHGIVNEQFIAAYGFGDQTLFNRQVEATLLEAVDHICSKRWGFDTLLVFFAYRRHQMALAAQRTLINSSVIGAEESRYYGQLSYVRFLTYCNNGYEHLAPLLEKLHDTTTSSNYKIEWGEGVYFFEGIEVGRTEFRDDITLFQHSPPESLPKLLPYLRRAFKNIQQACGEEELLDALAEFFWIFCMSKPCCKGEVTIAELFIKALFMVHHQSTKTLAWTTGLMPWCEVVCQPDLQAFVKSFRSFIVINERLVEAS